LLGTTKKEKEKEKQPTRVGEAGLQVHQACVVCILMHLADYLYRVHSYLVRIVVDLLEAHNDVLFLRRHSQRLWATLPTASL
jgi:hypothetical protein